MQFVYFIFAFLHGKTLLISIESKLKTVGITPESSGFPLFSFSHPCLNSFLPIITGLAEVHNVHGELLILQAVLSWLPRCKDIVLNVVKSKSNYTCDEFLLQFGTACSFLSDLLEQIKLISSVVSIFVVYATLYVYSLFLYHMYLILGDYAYFN